MAVGEVTCPYVVDAREDVYGVDCGKGDVEPGPEVLRVNLPAMLCDGGNFVEDPAGGVDAEEELENLVAAAAVEHGEEVEDH